MDKSSLSNINGSSKEQRQAFLDARYQTKQSLDFSWKHKPPTPEILHKHHPRKVGMFAKYGDALASNKKSLRGGF
jgi:hypothetical protein